MSVLTVSPRGDVAHAPGPVDLARAVTGWRVVVRGPIDPARDFARWAPALGAAALRGANVEGVTE